MMLSTLELNELEASELIYARFEPEFVIELLEVWPDSEKGKSGLSEPRFAQLCGLSQGAVYKYLHQGRYPDDTALKKMGEFLGVYFVSDWDNHIDNQKILKLIKAQHA
jgi:predicted DNA-binding transcriptional regulator AlpA